MRYYCVFEGGGAKGYAHIGVLRAIEEAGFDVRGYAGTSAGAIISTLACVGYTSDDLVHPTEDCHLLNQLGLPEDPFELLGPGKARILRTAYGRPWMRKLPAPGTPFTIPLMKMDQWVSAGLGFLVRGRTGLSTTDAARKAIETAIEGKFKGLGRATFHQLFEATGGKHLRIVAANISRRRLTLFSREETPDIVVSDAVAASIAIPALFEPVRIEVPMDQNTPPETCMFIDGGAVSNLPAWAFDPERAVDREAITVLSEISDIVTPGDETRFFDLVEPMLRTAIFGASRLNVRGIGRTHLVPLKVDLDLLSFGPKWDALRSEIDNARRAARLEFDDDAKIDSWMKDLRVGVADLLDLYEPGAGIVRTSLATPNRAEPYVEEYADDIIQLRYCQDYHAHPDYRQTLSLQRSLIGGVLTYDWDRRRAEGKMSDVAQWAYLFHRKDIDKRDRDNEDPRDRKMISQMPKDLAWWIVVPLRLLNPEFRYTDTALCIDGFRPFPRQSSGNPADGLENRILQSIVDYVKDTVPEKLGGRPGKGET